MLLLYAIASLLFTVFELGAIFFVPVSAQAERRKNVLFLMSDEHSGRVMGCAGDEIVKTPTFDSLADSGVLFQSAYCQDPICVPARTAIGTGRMPSKLGVFGNEAHKKDTLRDTPISLARIFTGAGYTAEWLGKDHWGTDNEGLGFGDGNEAVKKNIRRECEAYDDLRDKVGRLPENARTYGDEARPSDDEIVVESAIRWLDEYDGSKPFLLGVSVGVPHFPFMIEEKYYDMYKTAIKVPRVTTRMIQDLPSTNRKRRNKFKFAELTNKEIRKARAMYYGMVTFADYQLGRVLNKLDKKGLREDTIIVYMSDHGEHAGTHGLWYKNSFYEDSVMVPFIMSYPQAIPAKTRIGSPVQTMDVVPTLCDLCNISKPKELDGKSLVEIIQGKENGWRRHAISETYAGRAGRMVRLKKWKYCWYEDGGNQLFDIVRDPAEEFNQYNHTKYAKLIRKLHRIAMEEFVEYPGR